MPARALFAALGLLDRLGRPVVPGGFAGAPVVEIDRTGALRTLVAGTEFPVDAMRFPYRTANFVVARETVRAGHAICALDDRIGDAEPGVARILPDRFPV